MGSRANSNPFSSFAATTNDGHTICRNFNTQSGCTFPNCVYVHVCNRSISGEMLVDKPARVIPIFLRFSSQQGPHPNDYPFPTTLLTRMSGFANFKATRIRIFLRMALFMAFNWQILVLRSHQWTCKIINQLRAATSSSTKARVGQIIREEIMQGNYVITSSKPTVVSASGAIPMPNSTEIRIIYDCSRLHRQAVNDYITIRSFKFQWNDAIKLIRPKYVKAKKDLKHAYRSIPIRPANCQATGCKRRFMGDDYDTFFYDTRLPFKAKSSPEIFHRITQAVRHMMARRGFPKIVVYLDDFLVVGATRADCERAYNILVTLLQDLWFTISKQKLVPTTHAATRLPRCSAGYHF